MELNTIVVSDALDLLRGLGDKSIDAVITDMPYGTTACAWDTVIDLVAWWEQVKRVLKSGGVMLTTAAQPFTSVLVMSNLAWFRREWIWDKDSSAGFLTAKYHPLNTHESILVFAPDTLTYNPQMRKGRMREKGSNGDSGNAYSARNSVSSTSDDYYPKSIIRFGNNNQSDKVHPTQKPVELYEYLIRTYTNAGDIVLDPFVGSGTTAIAARNTGRQFIGGDSDAGYVAAANLRLINSDPYAHSVLPNGSKQLSLFAGLADDEDSARGNSV